MKARAMTVSTYRSSLVQYGVNFGLIEECDRIYITNQILQALSLDSCEPATPAEMPLEEILKGLLDDAVERGICGGDITSRDLLDTKLMGILTPAPREVRKKFSALYEKSPEDATDWYSRQQSIVDTVNQKI